MHCTSVLSAALLSLSLSPMLASAGILYVDNLCPFQLFLQSSTAGSATGPVLTLKANTVNAYHETEKGPGANNAALTISRTPNLASPLQMVYTQTGNPQTGIMYYDLSTKFGDPLRQQGFELLSGGNGYSVRCPPRPATGGGDCPNTYSPSNPNGQNAVFTQQNRDNMVLKLCAYK